MSAQEYVKAAIYLQNNEPIDQGKAAGAERPLKAVAAAALAFGFWNEQSGMSANAAERNARGPAGQKLGGRRVDWVGPWRGREL